MKVTTFLNMSTNSPKENQEMDQEMSNKEETTDQLEDITTDHQEDMMTDHQEEKEVKVRDQLEQKEKEEEK